MYVRVYVLVTKIDKCLSIQKVSMGNRSIPSRKDKDQSVLKKFSTYTRFKIGTDR